MSLVPLLNYPQPFGSRKINICQYQGPANYTTGGEQINASSFGWGSFDEVLGGPTVNANNSGNFQVQARWPVSQASNYNGGSANVNLAILAQNGTEQGANNNLSGEYARIIFIGG